MNKKTFEDLNKSSDCFYCHKPIKQSQVTTSNSGKFVHIKCKPKYDAIFR